jgi:hypothetical protein
MMVVAEFNTFKDCIYKTIKWVTVFSSSSLSCIYGLIYDVTIQLSICLPLIEWLCQSVVDLF